MATSQGWDGPGQGSASLSYYVGSVPSSFSLSRAEVEFAVDTALRAWAAVVDIDFTKTTRPGQARSLDFTFSAIDGAGGTLAQAYFPSDMNWNTRAGDVQFDTAEPYEIGNRKGSSAFDFLWVAVHEIGHALGLDHTLVATSVLAPTVSPNQYFVALDNEDITKIRAIYASTPGSVNTGTTLNPPTPPPSGTLTTTDTSGNTNTVPGQNTNSRCPNRGDSPQDTSLGRSGNARPGTSKTTNTFNTRETARPAFQWSEWWSRGAVRNSLRNALRSIRWS